MKGVQSFNLIGIIFECQSMHYSAFGCSWERFVGPYHHDHFSENPTVFGGNFVCCFDTLAFSQCHYINQRERYFDDMLTAGGFVFDSRMHCPRYQWYPVPLAGLQSKCLHYHVHDQTQQHLAPWIGWVYIENKYRYCLQWVTGNNLFYGTRQGFQSRWMDDHIVLPTNTTNQSKVFFVNEKW